MAWTVRFTWLFYALSALDEALDPIRGERDENIQRKSFSISEAVSVGRAIERLEKLAAQERQQFGRKRGGKARHAHGHSHEREGDQSSLLENYQEAAKPKKNTRDRVGAALAKSRKANEPPYIEPLT